MDKKLITTGFAFITVAIALGAFAAHGLKTTGVPADKIESFQTGVRYLFYSGFGFLLLVPLQDKFDFMFNTQYRQIFWGTLLFSLSIFTLVLLPILELSTPRFLGPITPIGGILIFIGWFSLLVKYLRNSYLS
ncbi:MAG: DUF423 domain-containing protein [Lishizhenia sp.]